MPDLPPEQILERAAARVGSAAVPAVGPCRVGVDLGTSSCVLVVLDAHDEPVWVEAFPSGALRDGVVVDFAGAAQAVALLKQHAEEALGQALHSAATGYPPCISAEDSRACRFVCEAAGFDDVVLVDEVSAAQRTLGVRDAVVIDVGGGSTGTGVFRGGRLESIDDRPGGGHHLDLILAGALGIDVAAAERLKRERPETSMPILVPGIERIAENIRAMTAGAAELSLHLAGGALMVPGAADILAKRLGRPVVSYPHAMLITPVGIARCAP